MDVYCLEICKVIIECRIEVLNSYYLGVPNYSKRLSDFNGNVKGWSDVEVHPLDQELFVHQIDMNTIRRRNIGVTNYDLISRLDLYGRCLRCTIINWGISAYEYFRLARRVNYGLLLGSNTAYLNVCHVDFALVVHVYESCRCFTNQWSRNA